MMDQCLIKPLAQEAIERSQLYGFLASIYRRELTEAALDGIRSPELLEALKGAGVKLDEGFLETPVDALIEELAMHYTLLFIGPGAHISPHQSVHSKKGKGLLNSLETVEVGNFIEASGFEVDRGSGLFPDHISVEMEFMAEMVRREGEALADHNAQLARQWQSLQQRFLSEHLERWAPDFCDRVLAVSESPFYSEMVKLTRRFLEMEKQAITDRSLPQNLDT